MSMKSTMMIRRCRAGAPAGRPRRPPRGSFTTVARARPRPGPRAAGELAGVDVDRGERLGLLDDEVATAVEPDPGLEQLLDLAGDPEFLEDGRRLVVELQRGALARHHRVEEVGEAVVAAPVVDDDLGHVGAVEVARHLEGDRDLVVDERRHRGAADAVLDLAPERVEEVDVGADLLVGAAERHRAHDEPYVLRAGRLAEGLQPLARRGVLDLLRHADAALVGQEDDVAAGQGEVGLAARALRADRVLHDLDHDLLADLERVLDPRLGAGGRVGRALLVVEAVVEVADVEEDVARRADVDERRQMPAARCSPCP
jgi:hypothetical protein